MSFSPPLHLVCKDSIAFMTSSIQPSLGEDIANDGPVASTITDWAKGDGLVPQWDVLVPRCLEPTIGGTTSPSAWPGKCLYFLCAFAACIGIWLWSPGACLKPIETILRRVSVL